MSAQSAAPEKAVRRTPLHAIHAAAEAVWTTGEDGWELAAGFGDEQGELDAAHAARVKNVTSRAVVEATNWGHVLHGGVGFMAEYDLQFHTRRGKEATLRWGDPRESLNTVAAAVLD